MAARWEPPAWATLPKSSLIALEVRHGSTVLKTHSLVAKKAFVLGRQVGVADLLVEDEGVSRQHAALVHKDDALFLIDLKSLAGVTVDGQRVKPLEATTLKEGSEIALGETALRYFVKGLAAMPPPPAASVSAFEPPAWAVVPPVPVIMQLQEGGQKIQSLDLSRHSSYVLGRSSASAKIIVPHDSVSRQHAAIVHGLRGDGGAPSVHIIDLNSAKGTFLDLGRGWTRLVPNAPTLWPPGGRLRLGDCPTRVVFPPPVGSAPPAGASTAAPSMAAAGSLNAPLQMLPPPALGASQALSSASTAVDAAAHTAVDRVANGASQTDGAADDAPQFSSLLSSTLVRPAEPEQEPVNTATDAAAAENSDISIGAAGPGAPIPLKNADFRNALLPFLSVKVVEEPSARDGSEKPKGKHSKKRRANDDSESDGEAPPPPMVLDKSEQSGGLILRKEKAAAGKKKASTKIKF
jgi:pSer/pThr/pTyr-binding forkhead associated (FHA) protein